MVEAIITYPYPGDKTRIPKVGDLVKINKRCQLQISEVVSINEPVVTQYQHGSITLGCVMVKGILRIDL